LARREAFGFLIFDKKSGELFISRDMAFSEKLCGGLSLKMNDNITSIGPDQILVFDTMPRKNDILSSPTYVELYPTMSCNERCKFCYVGQALQQKMTCMEKELVDITLSKLRDMGVFEISVLGGEPFLYKHLDYLVTRAVEMDFGVTISTNGTVHKFDLYKKFTDMKVKLSISFHSHIPEVANDISNYQMSFNKKVEAIRYLCKNNTPPHITIVATSQTKDSLLDTVKFLCEEGVTGITISHTMDAGYAKNTPSIGIDFWEYANLVEKAIELAKTYGAKLTCNTNFPFLMKNGYAFNEITEMSNMFYGTVDGRSALYVDYLGNIYPSTYDFGAPELRLGNIKTENMSDIWDNSNILTMIRTSKKPKQCNNCKYYEYCRGGPITNYNLPFLAKRNREFSCPLISETLVE